MVQKLALDKEQQRLLNLENRALEVEEQLLQRDRTRIRQAARARYERISMVVVRILITPELSVKMKSWNVRCNQGR